MNNNNQNNQNNYVKPEQVDLTKVNVDQTNAGALNRERDNIISATIQANDAINEKEAKTVNNTIKIKKKNPFLIIFVGIIAIAFAGFGAYLGYKLMDDYLVREDNKTTTTTTTTKKINHVDVYAKNFNKARKFANKDTVLVLAPKLVGLADSYMLTKNSNAGIQGKEVGTYSINDEEVILTSSDGVVHKYLINENGLLSEGNVLNMYDSEMKYYTYTDGVNSEVLIINATMFNEIAYYNGAGVNALYSYKETGESITLDESLIFTKNGKNILSNGKTYNLGQ